MNEAATGQGKGKTRLSMLIGILLIVALIVFISQVTARSLGERAENHIEDIKRQLEAIVLEHTDTLLSITLGTESKPAGLKGLVESHFRAIPAKVDNREIFQWLEAHRASMSEFRHDRLDNLILEGRELYQLKLAELTNITQSYENAIGSIYKGFWLRVNGYPRITLDDISR